MNNNRKEADEMEWWDIPGYDEIFERPKPTEEEEMRDDFNRTEARALRRVYK